jgi:hypothetical protein
VLRGLELAFDHVQIVCEQLVRRRGASSTPSRRRAPRTGRRSPPAKRGGARE